MQTVIVNFPFPFYVDGIAKGRRNPDRHWFRDDLPFEVPVVPASDAPHGLGVVQGRAVPARYRVHQGKLLQPVPTPESKPLTPAFLADYSRDAPIDGKRSWWQYPFSVDYSEFPAFSGWEVRPVGHVVPFAYGGRDKAAFRRVDVDGHASCRDRALAVAGSLVLIDGFLHARAAEPVYTVKRLAGVVVVEAEVLMKGAHDVVFRIDRRIDAVRCAEQIAAGGPVRVGGAPWQEAHVDWTFDDAGHVFERMLDQLDKAAAHHEFAQLPSAVLKAWTELRELRERGGGVPMADVVVACMALEARCADCRTGGRGAAGAIRVALMHPLIRLRDHEPRLWASLNCSEDDAVALSI